jgi:SSS family transporter
LRVNVVLIGVIIYILLQLAIGLAVSRRISNEDDYLLAGRSLGYGLATFSLFATWFGAETCIGSAGSIYERGLSGGSAEPFGYGICLLFMGLVFAVPLWRRRLTTLGDLFRQRFSPGVERLAVLIIIPTSILWAAAQIRAFGQVLDASSGLGVFVAISIAAAVAITYTVFGGLRADVITDLIQGVLIIGGLVLLAIVLWQSGDVQAGWKELDPQRLNPFGGGERSVLELAEAWAIPICGSVVAQELVLRILATRSPEVARRSALMGGGLYLAVGMIPVGIGLIGVSLLPGLDNPEQILPLLAQKHLSTFFYILFAGALLSAILSTVDSTLLAASSLISRNVIGPMRPVMSEAAKVRVARWGVMGCGLFAYVLALSAETIYSLVESASSFGSAGIFVTVVFGLFTKFGGMRAAFASLTTGLAVWLWATYVADHSYAYLLSLAAAFAAYVVGGVIDGRRAGQGGVIPAKEAKAPGDLVSKNA